MQSHVTRITVTSNTNIPAFELIFIALFAVDVDISVIELPGRLYWDYFTYAITHVRPSPCRPPSQSSSLALDVCQLNCNYPHTRHVMAMVAHVTGPCGTKAL